MNAVSPLSKLLPSAKSIARLIASATLLAPLAHADAPWNPLTEQAVNEKGICAALAESSPVREYYDLKVAMRLRDDVVGHLRIRNGHRRTEQLSPSLLRHTGPLSKRRRCANGTTTTPSEMVVASCVCRDGHVGTGKACSDLHR